MANDFFKSLQPAKAQTGNQQIAQQQTSKPLETKPHDTKPQEQVEPHSSWSTKVQDVILNALSLTGIKYRYGGTSPDTGFDCSGFVRYVFSEAANMALPHNARAISQIGRIISPDQLQPGDLVFYNTMKSSFSHVGIYLGNNRFIHAPSTGGSIHVAQMNDSYWSKRFDGARRIMGAD
ncbi:MAG: glycoside hydrolase [Betaproteobacteria bacterium HGW-Betaproteobacteria-8]|nr:MAG: glycoside hydrolase [Betaproteobacteria bacterium HGW-Betaproteobacteria-8]